MKGSTVQGEARWGNESLGSPPRVDSASADAVLAVSTTAPRLYSPRWLIAFVALEIVAQCLLLFEPIARARVVIRIMAFAGSLGLVFFLQSKSSPSHPSWRPALLAMFILSLSLLHPETSNVWAGIASVFLHLAVFGPIFWIPRLRIDVKTMRGVFLIFLVFNTASALFGALQVYYPGRFQPAVSKFLVDNGMLAGLEISLADGSRILRPMGLSDVPGGAAISGMYCVLLGTAFLLDRRGPLRVLACVVSMGLGIFALYLCQVRVLLVMVFLSILSMALPFAAQRRFGQFAKVATALAVVALVGFALAASVGGEAMTTRVLTLFESDPGTVYYSNRGLFLQHTLTELVPMYPVGAGLGRWGMIAGYFGENAAHGLWAEIQWTAWLYDGGVPLMVAYALAIVIALGTAFRIAARKDESDGEIQKFASVLFGYGVGVFATTFSACSFESTFGIDFWIMNATVFAASLNTQAAQQQA